MKTILLNSVYLTVNYGKNVTDVVLDNIFWLAILATIILFAWNIIKKNTQAAIISLILGSVASYLIKNPTVLEDIGNNLSTLIF